MARKKGGLGSLQPAAEKEDLLDSVFGGSKVETQGKDTPPPPAQAAEEEKVAKYFKLDREVVRKLRVYAAMNDMKEVHVIENALRVFLGEDAE